MKPFILLLLLFLSGLLGHAQEFPEPMQPKRIVNDFTALFNPRELATLEKKLNTFNDTSSTQIAVVTVASLYGYNANDYAQRLGEKWGVGQKGKDNGVVILIKPKSAQERGQVAIAVGYGLEGVIPDGIASRIIRREIIPAFQEGQFYAGVNNAVDVIMELSSGEYTAEKYAQGGSVLPLIMPFIIILMVVIILLANSKKGFTTDHNGSSGTPFIFLGGGGHRSGGFGGFSSGSGGFGGFGGGGFGGGGASGSW
ncbi:TPM domain-containing protein [Odoribacter sp. OttesenSCG-928-J03]|nr:TPM domain-containing protein [Odoribacter sp. OttesenSCG-928-J03]MDL2283220.1 TPM domain-containing protein [Odoribacter sp. OttesenSCG-928-G04]